MTSRVSEIGAAMGREAALDDQDPASGTAAMNADRLINSGAEFRSRLHWFIGAADVRTQALTRR